MMGGRLLFIPVALVVMGLGVGLFYSTGHAIMTATAKTKTTTAKPKTTTMRRTTTWPNTTWPITTVSPQFNLNGKMATLSRNGGISFYPPYFTNSTPAYPTRPYPTRPYPYPTRSYPTRHYPTHDYPTRSYPTQSYPTRHYPTHDYPTRSYPTPHYPTHDYPTRSYPTQSYPTRHYPTHDYPTRSYPTHDYPTRPYPTRAYPSQSYPTRRYPTRPYPTHDYPTTTYPPWTTAPPTSGVSVCVRYLSDFEQSNRIFTLSPASRTTLSLAVSGPVSYMLYLDTYSYYNRYFTPNIRFWSDVGPDIWKRVCLTVDTKKNVAQVFSGSNISVRKILPVKYVWSGEPVIEFSGFDGQVTDVQMWDYPLCYREIFNYMTSGVYGPYRGTVLTWSDISYSLRGNTLLEDSYEWQEKQPIRRRGRGRGPKAERKPWKVFNESGRKERKKLSQL